MWALIKAGGGPRCATAMDHGRIANATAWMNLVTAIQCTIAAAPLAAAGRTVRGVLPG